MARTIHLTDAQELTLLDQLNDAHYYRLGEASGLDDPDLDPDDRECLVRYDQFAAELGLSDLL